MKTRLLSSAMVLLALVFFWACDAGSSSGAEEATPLVNTSPSDSPAKPQLVGGPVTAKDTISLDTAVAWAKRWENTITSTSMANVQGYTLPIIDLQQVVNAGADSARFYLGQEYSGEYKLMLVGVNSKGEDMINKDPNTPLDRIYDLSNPCPPDCGDKIVQ